MSMNDPIANALSMMLNAEKKSIKECRVKPISKLLTNLFTLMKAKGYIGDFEYVEDGKGGFYKVNLLGRINKCGVIKPRFPVQLDAYEKYETRYLPAKDFGVIFVSTNAGLMSHVEAKKKLLGGKLIAYIY